ncbi:preprotein translocase subunit SecY [Actinomyces sp. zg-332]|uniref:preprotein translocase subunit SecY n=1 Tax=Actinomyces sp. zg-332 TaxID=2708340 RepID=UPI00141ED3D2|nr:preprotein translocase subunit SecY [Actinomyces sp. zg-332]QPK94268.1 preprotein translocase subunit SecY [Actinomyces sp. zg-332]
MFSVFAQALRTPDLRRKILFTLMIIVLFRAGSHLPTPGISYTNVQKCLVATQEGGFLSLVNLFSGGALLQLSVFALGITPYITASIIIQLLRVVIPRFEDLHQEGQSGHAVMTQYTRYLTIFLAILQSAVIISIARAGRLFPGCNTPIIPNNTVMNFIIMMITMTAGTGVIMWLAELITQKGIGNGMSLLIFTSIISNMPSHIWAISNSNNGVSKTFGVIGIIVAVTIAIVFIEQAARRIPVQYTKRMIGSRSYGGTTTYIPIKINISGVIPIIFAVSILALPQLIVQFGDQKSSWVAWVSANFHNQSALYLVIYAVLVSFFCFFYTTIAFNPDEVAENMKKYGGFIPGVRAGRPTAEYLRYVVSRITTAGAIYLVGIAMIPEIIMIAMGIQQMPFGGTTLLIMVGVGLQTVQQLNSQLKQHHYEGFLR